MKREIGLVAASMVLATAGIGTAWAFPGGQAGGSRGPQAMFERFDADGDGRVTREEVEAFRSERFDEMDADGDGRVTLDEMREAAAARAAERAEERFADIDDDGDGTISKDELTPGPEIDIFARLDQNDDGAITEDELSAGPWRGFGPHRGRFPGHGNGAE